MKEDCKIHDADFDNSTVVGNQGQILFHIRKIRNHYMIEPSELEMLKTLTPEQKKEYMSKDVDMQYAESGEQLNDPIDTHEKIYLVVRNITDRNVKQQYTLKKYDIIKLGRVKFKVKKIHIKDVEDERMMKRNLLKRRESEWRRKEIERLKNQ